MPSVPALHRPRGRPAKSGRDPADTRALLVRRATEMLTVQGVSATALDAVLQSVQVPKGSFYHFFESKDAFVMAALDGYASYFARKLDRHFLEPATPPLTRLAHFVDDACRGMERYAFQRGCLVGNLGQEVSGLGEPLRLRLEAVLCDWEQRLARCLADAMAAGQLAAQADCAALAHAFWVGWEGAVLRARLVRSTAPLQAFFQLFLAALPRP
ncbi:MAG: TetR family transcriptional regulator C-terminal domain-containing protein [Rhodoferax sp.]|uniref:acrylate utilization transcriptional regulator AcuR n=1 Tax=Rhodoferax sp. TaxID=50421 RepID=UPI00326306D1